MFRPSPPPLNTFVPVSVIHTAWREPHRFCSSRWRQPALSVTNVEASAAFYRDVLGFGFDGFANRQDGTPYYAEMLAGVRKFGLHEPTVEGQESRIGQARLYFRVLDLEAHHRRVSDAGATTGEIFHRDWMDMFIVKDADGHEIVFAVTDPERHTSDPWMARIE